MALKRFVVVLLALLAFSANSIFCRLALRENQIDAATFTFVRIVAGAVMLWLVVILPRRIQGESAASHFSGSWLLAVLLFGYAASFSFAYIDLNASTGGLILFGSVQATMVILGVVRGARPGVAEWSGLLVAVTGLVYLFLPKLESPPLIAGALMALAGACWGLYSIYGKGQQDAAGSTAGNFARAVPLAVGLMLAFVANSHATPTGLLLAVVSGAVTSALGYVLWYLALAWLTPTRAAVLQLSVPVLVAIEGAIFLGESLTISLAVASCLILGGALLAVFGKFRTTA